MGILDYFKPVTTWSAAAVREFLREKSSDEYNLVDVRQPKEYARKHLPGAKLMPVGQLRDRVAELNPDKTTIVY